MKQWVFMILAILVGGCSGDDDDTPPDTVGMDAADATAGLDAAMDAAAADSSDASDATDAADSTVDAPPAELRAEIRVLDTNLLGVTIGGGFSVAFPTGVAVTVHLEDRPPAVLSSGSCVTWSFSTEVGVGMTPATANWGTVTIDGSAQKLPPCGLDARFARYTCLVPGYTAGNLAGATAGSVLIDGSVKITKTGGFVPPVGYSNHVGRYVLIEGGTPVDGIYPIRDATDNFITIFGASTGSFTFGTEATFTILAGEGAVPKNIADPLTDTDPLVIGASVAPAVAASLDPGDAFTLTTESRALVPDVWSGGDAALQFACEGDVCGAAQAFLVVVTSTTADVTAAAPSTLPVDPRAGGRWIETRCLQPGVTTATVPVEHVALHRVTPSEGIAVSRTRTVVARVNRAAPSPDDVEVVAGHAFAGFTDVAVE